MASVIKRLHTYQKALIAFLILIIVYSLIGFLAVPWLVERQLSHSLQQRLQLSTSADKIRFNPVNFRSEISGLTLTDNGNTLLSLEKTSASISPLSLLLLKLKVDYLLLHSPTLTITRDTAEAHPF